MTTIRDLASNWLYGSPASASHPPAKSDGMAVFQEIDNSFATSIASSETAIATLAAAQEYVAAMQTTAMAMASILSVKPTGTSIYVSSVSANGIPVGNDSTGSGTVAAPYLTLTKALAVATVGSMIYLNGVPTSPTSYTAAAAAYGNTVYVGIDSVIPNGASISSSGTSRIIQQSADLWIGNVIIDSAGTIDRAIDFGVSTHLNLTLSGTKFKNIKTYGIYTTAANVSVFLEGCSFESSYSTCKGAYYLTGLTGGGVYSLTGYRADITAHGSSGFGAGGTMHSSVAGAVSVYLNNVVIRQVASASGVGSVYVGLSIQNIRNAVIVAPDIEMDMAALPLNSSAPLVIQPNSTTPLDTSGFVVVGTLNADGTRRGRIYSNSPGGGYGILAGYETLVAANGLMNNGTIVGMTITCSDATRPAAWHGILNGCKSNTIIKYNEVSGSIVLKEDDGATVLGNIVYGCSGATIRLKGSVNADVYHNTFVLSDSAGAYGLQVTNNTTTGTVSSGWTSTGNIYAVPAGVNLPRFVAVDAGNGGVISENLYYSTGTLDATAWSVSGVGYSTFAAWTAAEPTAAWGDPNFIAPLSEKFQITAPSSASARVTPLPGWVFDRNGEVAGVPKAAAGAFEVPATMSVPATEQQLVDTVAEISAMVGRVNTPSSSLPTADVSVTGSAALTVATHGSKNVKVTTGASDAIMTLPASAITGDMMMVSKADSGTGKVIIRTSGGADVAWLSTLSDWIIVSWWSGAWGAERWRIRSWRQVVRSSLASQPFPPLVNAVAVVVRSGGGGGAGGASGLAGTVRIGGGGGAAGEVKRRTITRAAFGASWNATIGAGGAGGGPGTTGSDGGNSAFTTQAGARVYATSAVNGGRSNGAGGQSYAAAAGGYPLGFGDSACYGGTASATGSIAASTPVGRGCGGGGAAGGGVTSGNTASAGQTATYNDLGGGSASGGAAGVGSNGAPGESPGDNTLITSTYAPSETTAGGAGGGGSDAGVGGAGGNGYDGGGGGGGGGGITGGAGGAGGNGVIYIKWEF